jgi:UDP-N-acetylglucosamine--N-acetylmuramyl-(pentapeptide) pyrophosphoryl-undecaprenol N-acetylglucosamine transferase
MYEKVFGDKITNSLLGDVSGFHARITENTHLPSNGLTMVVTAGGTGGHMYPAEAVAKEGIRRGYKVHLITDKRGLRYAEGFKDIEISEVTSASVTTGGILSRVAGVLPMCEGVSQAMKIIDKVKPSFIVGFGGYPAVPALTAAVFKGIPIYIHEQNAILGQTNLLFATFAKQVGYSFYGTARLPRKKSNLVGNPVRDNIRAYTKSPYPSLEGFARIQVLIIGGSQGAAVFERIVPKAIQLLPRYIRERLHIVQQMSPEHAETAMQMYRQAGVVFDLYPYIPNMGEQMARSHLVICRSGASTIAELMTVGRPSILVPYPRSKDHQQVLNARLLTERDAGWMIMEYNFTPQVLAAQMRVLFEKPHALQHGAQVAGALGIPNASFLFLNRIEQELALDRPTQL